MDEKKDIRKATMADFALLSEWDEHITAAELENCIRCGRVLLAVGQDGLAGFLRWNLFWDNTPFLNMLYILESERNKGFGKQLVALWEKERKNEEYSLVMTSTLASEAAQGFYRKQGYRDAGALLLPKEPLEIIFVKQLVCQ